MQERIPLDEQYLQILQVIKSKLDRKKFCILHNMSEAKLSRILNANTMPKLSELDYMAMSCGMELTFILS